MANKINIPGYEGYYTIDIDGNVYSKNGKIRKTKISNDGYEHIILTKNKKQFSTSIHRLLAISFILNNDGKSQVNHKDGNKLNNSIKNLEWVTSKENLNHAWKNGLMKYRNSNKNGKLSGDGNGRCKISDNELIFIRKNYNGSCGEDIILAQKYNVSLQHMRKLLNNFYRGMII